MKTTYKGPLAVSALLLASAPGTAFACSQAMVSGSEAATYPALATLLSTIVLVILRTSEKGRNKLLQAGVVVLPLSVGAAAALAIAPTTFALQGLAATCPLVFGLAYIITRTAYEPRRFQLAGIAVLALLLAGMLLAAAPMTTGFEAANFDTSNVEF